MSMQAAGPDRGPAAADLVRLADTGLVVRVTADDSQPGSEFLT
ncbi:MAG: hypothetical protein M0030_11700, partial [Actinomycetota bacterium]|nr:hypothetical protein [Actinomycetota bacterium]